MTEWIDMLHTIKNLEGTKKIALVGKYIELQDAYISVNEALRHAGYVYNTDVKVTPIQSEDITKENVAETLAGFDGIIVPGGFGDRGLEG